MYKEVIKSNQMHSVNTITSLLSITLLH